MIFKGYYKYLISFSEELLLKQQKKANSLDRERLLTLCSQFVTIVCELIND